MSDLSEFFNKEEISRRWKAETENASARYELALINEREARLISQHDPLAKLNINRDHLRLVFAYLHHGNLSRLNKEIEEL